MNKDISSSYNLRIVMDENNANYVTNVTIMMVKQLERSMISNCF